MKSDVERWLNKDGEIFLQGIGIKKNDVVLDFGCGAGHYTIPAAKAAGKEGKVYAVDKDSNVLSELEDVAAYEGLNNIVTINTSGKINIEISDNSIDVALAYDVLHYLNRNEREKLYSEIYRILKVNGLFSIYPKHNRGDEPLWNLSEMGLEDIIKEVKSAGFRFDAKYEKILLHDYNYNKGYILNFRGVGK